MSEHEQRPTPEPRLDDLDGSPEPDERQAFEDDDLNDCNDWEFLP